MRIYGSFTYDLINGKKKLGGSALYSTLGSISTGTKPELVSVGTKDQPGCLVNFLDNYTVIETEKPFVFSISFNGNKRSLVLKLMPSVKVRVKFNGWGVINPLCNEFEVIEALNSYLDVQGTVRECEVGKEIRFNKEIKLPEKIRGIHANYQELPERLPDLSEVIVSYDEDGFELRVKGEGTYRIKPEVIGDYSVGTGDFLLGAYASLREKGAKPFDAAKITQKLLEEFSTLGLDEWTRRRLGCSIL